MTLALFLPAVFALLAVPGPTNTLMAVAGAQSGMVRAFRLIPAVLGGYFSAIIPVACFGRDAAVQFPLVAVLLKLAAAIWILALCVKLWRAQAPSKADGAVTAADVYLTTVLNPKALIIGAVLLPVPGSTQFALAFGLFALLASALALGWAMGGSLTQFAPNGRRRMEVIQRAASVWLALVSGSLVASAVIG